MAFKIFTAAFLGRVAGGICVALFIAICGALGFGPDRWAAIVLGVDPTLAARCVFGFLAIGTTIVVIWPYARRIRNGERKIVLPLLATVVFGLCFFGSLFWLLSASTSDPTRKATSRDVGREPTKPPPQVNGIAALTNEQLSFAVIEYAKRIRTFDSNSSAQIELATSSRTPLPPDFQTNPEARAAFSKANQELFERQNATRIKMQEEQQLIFRNEYAAQGRELEKELKARLALQGKLAPYGKDSERMVLDDPGYFAGPRPISRCADYLERNAKALAP